MMLDLTTAGGLTRIAMNWQCIGIMRVSKEWVPKKSKIGISASSDIDLTVGLVLFALVTLGLTLRLKSD
jgi:hypothetical protein